MRKGKIKALLFIIVFLLVMATAIALLLDMEREKKEVQELGYDPYAATPVPTLAPTVTPMPVSTIMPTPVPPTPVPVGQVIGSGSFRSETGVPLNVRADWTAGILDANTVGVKVDVYLESYSLQIIASHNAVNISVGDNYQSSDTPDVNIDDNSTLHSTLIATTMHTIPLSGGEARSFPMQVQYLFRGTYFKQEIDTIECGGAIQLAR